MKCWATTTRRSSGFAQRGCFNRPSTYFRGCSPGTSRNKAQALHQLGGPLLTADLAVIADLSARLQKAEISNLGLRSVPVRVKSISHVMDRTHALLRKIAAGLVATKIAL